METRLNVVIVIARCTRDGHGYGIRLEETTKNCWIANWAFAIKEKAAEREGYKGGRVSGNFAFAAEYPGCPHCSASGIYECRCGHVACWDGESNQVTCPWCKNKAKLAGEIKSLRTEHDR